MLLASLHHKNQEPGLYRPALGDLPLINVGNNPKEMMMSALSKIPSFVWLGLAFGVLILIGVATG